MNQPGIEKDNAFTRLDAQVRELNRNTNPRSAVRFNTAEPPPAVSTPAMREAPPLPAAEIERLNRLAAEAGVEGFEKPMPVGIKADMLQARAFLPQRTRPFLPDFTKIQSIDLVKNAVIIDDVEFEFNETDKQELLEFCMDVVMDTLSKLVATAKVKHHLIKPEPEPIKDETPSES